MKRVLPLICTLLFISNITEANNYYVTTVSDTGAGSLRAMVDSANARTGLDTITLSLSAHDTIHLASPLATISDSLVITGLPCQNPTISGDTIAFYTSAIYVSDYSIPLTLNYLNIINCNTLGPDADGAVYVAGPLYLNYCYFYANSYSQNSGNSAAGAVCAGNIWAYNSTFSHNSCNGYLECAGALYSRGAYLFNCTFVANSSIPFGGAISGNVYEIQNCTIADNYASIGGGAIYSDFPAINYNISNSIIWGNTISDTTGTHFPSFEFSLHNISSGCNILQDSTRADSFKTVSSDIVGVNPQFGAFGYYSGCVPVLPILCGSVAENHASCPGATDTDAEGIAAQGIRDAGAFEITHPNLGGDTIDSIQPGTMANLYNYFNTTGLTMQWPALLTDSTAAAVDTGSYTVIGTNFLGCSDTATAIVRYAVDTTSGIKSISAGYGIKLYPNPAQDVVNITWSAKFLGPVQLKITDMMGQIVFAQNIDGVSRKYAVNISSLGSGAYYVSLNGNGQSTDGARMIVLPR